MLFPMIQNIFTFLEKTFLPYWGADDIISRDYQNYKNVTIFFFFSLFSHKKHFYEQNMLATRLLEQDYIWVLTIAVVCQRCLVLQKRRL